MKALGKDENPKSHNQIEGHFTDSYEQLQVSHQSRALGTLLQKEGLGIQMRTCIVNCGLQFAGINKVRFAAQLTVLEHNFGYEVCVCYCINPGLTCNN